MKKNIQTILITTALIVTFSVNVLFANEVNVETNTISQNETTNETTENSVNNISLIDQATSIQEEIAKQNSRLEYVEGELSAALITTQELTSQIEEYELEYSKIQTDVNNKALEIQDVEASLQEKMDEYRKKDELLKKRVVAMYEAGETTYLDLLTQSSGIVEFLSNYYLIEEIIEYDNELLENIAKEREEIEKTQEKLVKEKQELDVALEKAHETEILLLNTRTMEQTYVDKLNDEEKAIREKIEEYKQEQARIETEIRNAIIWGENNLAITYSGGPMIWPVGVEGTRITSNYGTRLHPIQGVYKFHSGLDIGNAGYGAPALAAEDGVVTYAGWMGGYGNCVMISHGNGISTLYGHGQTIITEVGAEVKQGDVIMLVGSTGNSTGPHLHFEVRLNGTAVNPLPYLNGEMNRDRKDAMENVVEGENTNSAVENASDMD